MAKLMTASFKPTVATESSAAVAARFWIKAWSPACDPLAGALANNDTKLARSLVAGLIQPKGTESTGASAEADLDSIISITPGAVPGLLDDIKRLYASSLGPLATDILREHTLEPLHYPLQRHGKDIGYDYTRVDLGDHGFVSAGSEQLIPTFRLKENGAYGDRTVEECEGIDWSDHLRQEQYADGNPNRVEVKPIVLAVCGSGHAGSRGLLHLLSADSTVPVDVFNTRAVRVLLQHKWNAFGQAMFRRECMTYVVRAVAWQALAFMVAQHGTDAVAKDCRADVMMFGVALASMQALRDAAL